MYGFHKNKRIVLFDTLIEGYVSSTDRKELEAKKNDDISSENSTQSPVKDVSSNSQDEKDQDKKVRSTKQIFFILRFNYLIDILVLENNERMYDR